MKLVFNKGASRWGEALPVGNGHIGAMVFGGWPVEEIILTENTFYSGERAQPVDRPDAREAFFKMRRLAERGAYDAVHAEAARFIGARGNYGTNLPVGSLFVDYITEKEGLQSCTRGLDIQTGTAWAYHRGKEGGVLEEVIVSHPAKVLMLSICSIRPLKFRVRLDLPNGTGVPKKEGTLRFQTDAAETIHCDQKTGVHLEGIVSVQTDGTAASQGDALVVSGSRHTTLYLAMETNFGQEGLSKTTLQERAARRCACAARQGGSAVRAAHRQDLSVLREGMKLEIDGTDTVSRIIPFLFQYGRYLLFCSSREDSKLPAHLQGIWNDNVACRVAWTCDMHLDINTQMNYWPAESTGLSQTTAPLFRWIREYLVQEGRQTAMAFYGQSGWVAELVSNAWGYAAPYWSGSLAPCPTGGVWLLSHMWEHYLYTEDRDFLQKQAFPLIEEAVCFFRGYVYEREDGSVGCGPSISPENSFLYKGAPRQISVNCTYETLMIRQLFYMYLEAARILQLSEESGLKEVETLYHRLPPYRVLENGCIAEWSHTLPEADPQHRHISHLLGLYPFAQLTPEKTPALCEAAKRTIQRKLTPPEGWEDTGWSRSMLALYEARLQDGEQAYLHICSLAKRLLEPNGMVFHPPTRGADAFAHVYELDGNTGLTAAITEMLIQSHDGMLRLLPALPAQWKRGRIKGYHARGNLLVDMEWENKTPKQVRIYAVRPVKIKVAWGAYVKRIVLRRGVTTLTYRQLEEGGDS